MFRKPLSQDIPLEDLDFAQRTPTSQQTRMKFSHSLQFNAVPEWSSKYISYSSLKKVAYTLQRKHADTLSHKRGDDEAVFTQDPNDPHNPVVIFSAALDVELEKINKFFTTKEAAIYSEWKATVEEFAEFVRDFPIKNDDIVARNELKSILGSLGEGYVDDIQNQPIHAEIIPDDSNHLSDDAKPIVSSPTVLTAENGMDIMGMSDIDFDRDSLKLHKKRSLPTLFDDDDFCVTFLEALKVEKRKLLVEVFTHLSELKSYVELNKIGFGKALKKFDKLLSTNLKAQYMPKLEENHVFAHETTETLNATMEKAIELYSVFTHGRIEEAKADLRANLREKVVFERNTVWRTMIGMERKSQAAYAKRAELEGDDLYESAPTLRLPLGAGRYVYLPHWLVSFTLLKLVVITTITLALLRFPVFEDFHQSNCLALVVCASLLWATEAVPLFVTSLFVPFLIVVLRVLKDPETGNEMTATEASKFICGAMWSPIILLLLGGFTLAAALSRYNLDKHACTFLLSKVSQTPATILFSIMLVSTTVASLVSNVAAPVLMYSVIQPILNTLPEGSQFAQALVLGVALASDIAGMASPIASPQNVVALQFMDPQPNWIQWFAISIPVSLSCLVVIFIFLVTFFQFRSTTIVPIKMQSETFDGRQIYVIIVTVVTIILWCLASVLEPIFGDMGMISVLSMFAFYAPGILSGEDFNNYPWTIVILAMGGLALGKAVSVSGLLTVLASGIQAKLMDADLFTVLAVFGSLVLMMATFVSHTVAALITVPLVAEIGRSLPDPHPNLLVMATAMLCSCAMGLPTSGFPNVTAIGLTDSVGNKYLSVSTFIAIGVPVSLFCGAIVITLGYLIMKLLHL